MTTGRFGPSACSTVMIRFQMLLLGRVGLLAEVEEFGAIQADAFAAAVEAVACTPCGNSMLPSSWTRTPSRVTAGRSRSSLRLALDGGGSCGACCSYCASVSSSGSMMSRPWLPSTMTRSPPETSVMNVPRPTTAGISSTPATMAVWLVRPPASVAKAWTRLGSSDGGFARRQVVGQHDHRLASIASIARGAGRADG